MDIPDILPGEINNLFCISAKEPFKAVHNANYFQAFVDSFNSSSAYYPIPPHYLNHHSHLTSTLPQPSLTPNLHTTSTITH
ncbi:MAG: hypothetical protein L0922_05565, partial [Candidatus Mariimomonas ferrooxydans]